MDVIEEGFSAVLKKIEELKGTKESLEQEVKDNDARLLGRMATKAAPLISSIGLNMLKKGKKDTKREIFDQQFYPQHMFILGKTEPIPFRPDDPQKAVTSQYCVLSEEGKFFELMYSENQQFVDSYLNPISPEDVLELYGYDIMFMLYRALRDYLNEEQELVAALEQTLDFIFLTAEKE